MAPKPRGRLNQHGIPNLYIKFEERSGKYSAQYKDPRGKDPQGKRKEWHSLGTGKELSGPEMKLAKERAKRLNAMLAKEVEDHKISMIMENRPKNAGLTMSGWLVEYRKILDKRLEDGDIRESTRRWISNATKAIDSALGPTPLRAITVKQIADWIKTYKAADKASMGRRMRSILIDVFTEAVQAGEADANPAKLTARPKAKTKQARLTLDDFNTILEIADNNTILEMDKQFDPWLGNAMRLAVVFGQRREEVATVRFCDIKDGYLEVTQKKTGTRIKIPLALRLNAIGMSLEDVVRRCRDGVVSQYLIHHTENRGNARKGAPVNAKTITTTFAKARDLAGLSWGESKPPAFNEHRSLAGRLYKAEGIDTQALLGHKDPKTTEIYHDARGHDWVVVQI